MADRQQLYPLFEQADMVFTTFDNFAARYVLGLAVAQAHVPLVNSGALTFEGDVELLRVDQEGCIECLWESEDGAGRAAERREHRDGVSCSREDQEVADIGTAIVTTNAIVGSLQAIVGLTLLAAPDASPESIDHNIRYSRAIMCWRVVGCRISPEMHGAASTIGWQPTKTIWSGILLPEYSVRSAVSSA